MKDLVPYLEDALNAAEKKLGDALKKSCRLGVHVRMSEELTEVVEQIDHEKFRPELQYTLVELTERCEKGGFLLFTLTCDGEPTAFLYGYTEEADVIKFFIDSIATRVEGKGIGSILATLALVYCYDTGYSSVELFTEEVDDKGRHLVKFYESLGFQLVGDDPDNGIVMSHDLQPLKIKNSCIRFLGLEKDPQEFSSIHNR